MAAEGAALAPTLQSEPAASVAKATRNDAIDARSRALRHDDPAPAGPPLATASHAFSSSTAPAASTAGGADLDAFAAMLERVASPPSGAAEKILQVRFPDQGGPLAGVRVSRAADGSLAVAVSSTAQTAARVGRAVDGLKRRLDRQGLIVDEIEVEADAWDDTLRPPRVGRR